MKKSATELKVGLLTLIAIIVLAVGTLFVGQFQWFQPTYEKEVYFDFVSGLQEGAPVRLNGVRVGSVKTISIRSDKSPSILVLLQLAKNAKVHKDARVFVNTLGLMGEKYVEIYAGSAKQPFLADSEPLYGQSPTELQDVLNASKDVAENLAKTMKVFADTFTQESTKFAMRNFLYRMDSISKNLDEIVTSRKGDIEVFAKNLRGVSENMKVVIGDIQTMLNENRGDVKKISSNLAETTEAIKAHSSKIAENLDVLTEQLRGTATDGRPDLQTTLKNFKDASEDFKKSMSKLETITSRIEKGEGTVGKLMSDETLYNQTTATVGRIKEAANTIAGGGKFLSGIQFEYEMRYRDRLHRARNDIHVRITPNDEKYYIIGASDIGQDVGLDMLYARREGPLDIKLGILESKAAAGLEYNLIKDRLSVGVLGIGLSASKPRVDVQSTIGLGQYWDVNWYLVGGADDVTQKPKANAGVQIRY